MIFAVLQVHWLHTDPFDIYLNPEDIESVYEPKIGCIPQGHKPGHIAVSLRNVEHPYCITGPLTYVLAEIHRAYECRHGQQPAPNDYTGPYAELAKEE